MKKMIQLLTVLTSSWTIGQTSQMYFQEVPAEKSGITFKNQLSEVDSINYINFQYMYNGGGVAIGDINNDGLSDIYFTGNQVSDKLYLNKGNLQFEDITENAIGPLAAAGWRTGVTMADVNGDGWLDIYVSRSGREVFGKQRSNLLYINQGNNTFKEEGALYGVDIDRGTNQAAFFDMDKDGDLDLYVMNRRYPPDRTQYQDLSVWPFSDNLLENVGGKFVDITSEAGIQNNAYGLGLTISDLNQDGWLDIYVSNDFIQPDFMYINQGNKTFKEEIITRTNHTSQYGMGNDIADFNNDGLVDIMVVDMVSEDHVRNKKNMGAMSTEQFWHSIAYGNQYEYMFNTAQLNNGNGTFSEVAQVMGVSKTDWSWGPLFADFDNDGLKDLFITNGYRRDVTDGDFVSVFNSGKYKQEDYKELLALAPETKVPNYMFKNEGDLTFTKVIDDWKLDKAVNSNGAAYADLDNDGDLDLVVNNMEDVSSIWENKLKSENHYVRVAMSSKMIGVKVTVRAGGQKFFQEFQPCRGFQSSMEYALHFGIGKADMIEEVYAEFPDGRVIRQANVKADQLIKLTEEPVDESPKIKLSHAVLFKEVAVLDHLHKEQFVDDFSREVLIPHRMSQLGPFMSSGDVNGDGKEDIYISGSRFFPGALYLQIDNGFEVKEGPWIAEKEREELDSKMLDVDGDGDLDLYVVSGSNEYKFYSDNPLEIEYNKNLQDQLYINDGVGNFTNETKDRLPEMVNSGQRIAVGDIDGDGDLDIFAGGRQIPGYYPQAPRSYLLINDKGVFKDATESSPDLMKPGMITDALFEDFDKDGDLDLVVVGEWMPLSFFKNTNGAFTNVTAEFGTEKTVGWWMSIAAADINKDGVTDYVAGNIGGNNKFHPSSDHPLEIYLKDFDQNGTYDIVLGEHQNNVCYPVRGRGCSSQQMPFIKQKYATYDAFAKAQLHEIYGQNQLDSALHYSATNFSSAVLLSGENGFELKDLPVYAQIGPTNAISIEDLNGDGNLDILGVGNNFGSEIETIRYDGGRGLVALGDGAGNFKVLAPYESGFFVNTDAKDLSRLGNWVFVSSNNAKVKVFSIIH